MRILGDYAEAVGTGERAKHALEQAGLSSSVEAVQLSLTIAAAYFEAGDRIRAQQLCRQAVGAADSLDAPVARASAYWNAGVIESRNGNTDAAIPLVRSALTIFEASDDARNAARLQSQLGILQLRLDLPDAAEAKATLMHASTALEWSNSSEVERGRNDVALARAHLLLGELDESRGTLERGKKAIAGASPTFEAEAWIVEGQLAFVGDDVAGARDAYTRASHLLTGVGDDAGAGDIWYELGALFEEVGDLAAATAAYRSAGAAAGLRSQRLTVPATSAARLVD